MTIFPLKSITKMSDTDAYRRASYSVHFVLQMYYHSFILPPLICSAAFSNFVKSSQIPLSKLISVTALYKTAIACLQTLCFTYVYPKLSRFTVVRSDQLHVNFRKYFVCIFYNECSQNNFHSIMKDVILKKLEAFVFDSNLNSKAVLILLWKVLY